jgi:hypothetical protein
VPQAVRLGANLLVLITTPPASTHPRIVERKVLDRTG